MSEIIPLDHVRRRPLTSSTLGYAGTSNNGPPWEPNHIDYRHSLVQADKRAAADDETLEICAHCGCEVDIDPAPHRPNCAGIGAPRASSATVVSLPAPPREQKHTHRAGTKCPIEGCRWQARHEPDGLELLERMDAGLPVADQEPDVDAELEEVPDAERLGPDGTGISSSTGAAPELAEEVAAAVGDFTESGTAGSGSSSEPERAAATSNTRWTQELVLAALKRWADEHDGQPPTQKEWVRRGDYWPVFSTAGRLFGGWGAAIEAAGLKVPARGRRPAARELEINSKSQPGWIKVNGTGLAYRTPSEAYIAADEIEADGERVAAGARDAGDEAKADQAIDAARALAEKIRGAARAADERAEATSRPAPSQAERKTTSPGHVVAPEPISPAPARSADPPPDRLLITPEAMPGIQRAYAVAAIAAARTFADTLEAELARD